MPKDIQFECYILLSKSLPITTLLITEDCHLISTIQKQILFGHGEVSWIKNICRPDDLIIKKGLKPFVINTFKDRIQQCFKTLLKLCDWWRKTCSSDAYSSIYHYIIIIIIIIIMCLSKLSENTLWPGWATCTLPCRDKQTVSILSLTSNTCEECRRVQQDLPQYQCMLLCRGWIYGISTCAGSPPS